MLRNRIALTRNSLDPAQPDRLFDNDWYLQNYPDVAAATRNGWAHFVEHGEAEGRAPGPDFDPEFYRRTYLPLEGDRPFTHYVEVGRALAHVPRSTPLSGEQTVRAIDAALDGRPNVILLIGNDARAAGAPLLLLEIARRLRARGWSPVFLLKQSGPLFTRFAALGPTLISEEGWDLSAMGAALPHDVPILANTAWGALLADRLGVAPRTVVLVHEMAQYLVAESLLEPVGRAHTVVASMPRVRTELSTLLAQEPRLTTVVPGLRAPVTTRAGQRRVRRSISERFAGDGAVHLGAGYADARKGFDLFLQTARTIAALDPEAVFVWLGDLGSWAQALADDALADGLRLLLPGFRTDAHDWYAVATVYLLTSRQDPGPTTVMDAACVGTPFVGLAADIGIRDLAEVVDATGLFVEDTDALAREAVQVARAESPATRAARAGFMRDYRSLDVYVDDLERLVDEVAVEGADEGGIESGIENGPGGVGGAGSGSAGTRGARTRSSRSGRVRARLRLAALDLRQSDVPRYITSATRSSARRLTLRARRMVGDAAPRMIAEVAATRRPRLVSIVVAQNARVTGVPTGALDDPEAVAALTPGDRAWITDPALLSSLRAKADLHILRDPDSPPWPLIAALEPATDRIARVSQYDGSTGGHRFADRAVPPRPRRQPGSSSMPQASTALASHAPVRLARPIGVFVHAYYVDILPTIVDRLEMIDHPFDLYVSTTSEEKAEAIRALVPTATVRVFANRGRDIAPKVFGFAREHEAHDVVLHLHTKRSPHQSRLAGWLPHLLDCLLPSPEGVNAIIALFAEVDRIGMVSPAHYSGLGTKVGWGPNRTIAEVMTWGAGWPALPEDQHLAFAAGSMFWARSASIAPLQRTKVPAEAFSDSPAPDGTLPHALERLIGVSSAVAGFDQVFVGPGIGSTTKVDDEWALTTDGVRSSLSRRGPAVGRTRVRIGARRA